MFVFSSTDSHRIKPFVVDSDARSKWLKWKRAFELYLDANDITDPKKKKTQLLHVGGEELQDVFDSFIETDVEETDKEGNVVKDDQGKAKLLNVYDAAVCLLDEYFAPRQNITFERHILRKIKQDETEGFDDFVKKITHQIKKCGYCKTDTEKETIQQIVEGCKSDKLRERLLEKERNLEEVKSLGRSNERIARQTKSFATNHTNPTEIQRVDKAVKRTWSKAKPDECYRCGRRGHRATDKKCPAWGQTCNVCHEKNHFAARCTKKSKQIKAGPTPPAPGNKRVRLVGYDDHDVDEGRMVFHVENKQNTEKIVVVIADSEVVAIIDSGASCNMLTKTTYETIINNSGAIHNSRAVTPGQFKCYGVPEANSSIEIIRAFEASINVGTETHQATFYVSEHGKENLIGRETALKLRILKLGPIVQRLTARVKDDNEFPKIPGVEVSMNIDPVVKPSVAAYRNIPLALEDLVDKKLDYLLKMKIGN